MQRTTGKDMNMTAPKVCEHCGACLDAGEHCDCQDGAEHKKADSSDEKNAAA